MLNYSFNVPYALLLLESNAWLDSDPTKQKEHLCNPLRGQYLYESEHVVS